MSPEQKFVVKVTWQLVVLIADTAAELFYDRLFELDPQLRSLFVGVDLASQRKKLVQALTTVVEAIEHIEDLVPVIQQLGQRHRSYGRLVKRSGAMARPPWRGCLASTNKSLAQMNKSQGGI